MFIPVDCRPLCGNPPQSLPTPPPGWTGGGGTTPPIDPTIVAVTCPTIPATAVAGSAALLVRVMGQNFTAGCSVLLDGAPQATTFVNTSELNFTLTPGAAATTHTIQVDCGGAIATGTCQFTITAAPLVVVKPILTKIWPDYVGKLDGVAKVVTITGDLFDATSKIMQDLVELPTTFVNAQTLTFTTNPATIVTHSAEIRVQNGAASNTQLSDNFALFQCVWNVELVEAWPPSVPVGDPPTVIEVTGYGMGNTAEVLMDGVPQPTTWVNGTRCSFVVTPATETARTVQIAVRLGHDHTPEGHDDVMPMIPPLTVPFTFS